MENRKQESRSDRERRKAALPSEHEAEKSILAAILLDPEKVMPEAMVSIKPFHFHLQLNQLTFECMIKLVRDDKPVEFIGLVSLLEKQKHSHELFAAYNGPRLFVSEILDGEVRMTDIAYYVGLVVAAWEKRQLYSLAANTANQVLLEPEWKLEKHIQMLESGIADIVGDKRRKGAEHITQPMQRYVERLENRASQELDIVGIPTGLRSLDVALLGLVQNYYIIAARPSMGKTSLALKMAMTGASVGKIVYFREYEMSAEQLVERMVAMTTGIDSKRLRRGDLTIDDWRKIMAAFNVLGDLPVYIDDNPAETAKELHADVKKFQMKNSLDLLIVDHLGYIIPTNGGTRNEEVAEISREMVNIKKDLACPVVALSQLSRAVEQRMDKRPILSDMRDSGSLEQDADTVIMLYREEYYTGNKPNEAEILIRKDRDGGTEELTVAFNKKTTVFADWD